MKSTKEILLSQEELIELLKYDMATGGLTWKERSIKWFTNRSRMIAWNKRWANKPAGYKTCSGIMLSINSILYLASRIIYKMVNGQIGLDEEIIHKDYNGFNNAWTNLKSVDGFHNRIRSRYKTKVTRGITIKNNAYHVNIAKDSINIYLGKFDMTKEGLEKAINARKMGEMIFWKTK